MSDFLAEPCRQSRSSGKEENEIRKIFYQHWEKLKNRMEEDIVGINEWRSRSIQEIKSYADEQIRILKFDYDNQRRIFDEKRTQNLELAKVYRESREKELFSELCTACQSLQFQVAQLENVVYEKSRPKVITVEEQMKRTKQDTAKLNRSQFENNRTRSTNENVHIRDSNENDITRSFGQSIPSMSNETQ
ncbi:unnamed protein product [Rotaria sp. Silwood2]|nr:unnamed protein product [Rotaria sp. Silwood2]CAF4506791.1 unnamed protein product [Rotaria sp. Silwood2]